MTNSQRNSPTKRKVKANKEDLVPSLAVVYTLYTVYEYTSSFAPLFILYAGQGKKKTYAQALYPAPQMS